MTQEVDSNGTVDDAVVYDAVFDVESNRTIDAVFEINPMIADLYYVHSQDTPATTWNIIHNLGKFPTIAITDTDGNVVMGDICYVDKNTVRLQFNIPFSGKAYLN